MVGTLPNRLWGRDGQRGRHWLGSSAVVQRKRLHSYSLPAMELSSLLDILINLDIKARFYVRNGLARVPRSGVTISSRARTFLKMPGYGG